MPYLFLLAALASPAFEDLEILDERILVVSEHAEQIDKRLKLAECPDERQIATGGPFVKLILNTASHIIGDRNF